MHSRLRTLAALLVVIAGMLAHGPARGQSAVPGTAPEAAPPATGTAVTVPVAASEDDPAQAAIIAELESKKQALETDTSLEEAVRTQAVQSYGQAIATYQERSRVTTEREKLRARVDAAPERIKTLKETAPPKVPEPPTPPSADTTIEALQQQLRDAEAALESAERALTEHESALAGLQKAATSLGTEMADRRARIEKLRAELDAPAAAGVLPRVREARLAALTARKALREAEIELYQRQLSGQDLLAELTALEREAAAAAVLRTQATVDAVRGVVQSRREAEAEGARTQAEAAKKSAARLPAPIVALASQNVALSTELEELTKKGATIVEKLKAVEARSREISSDFAATRQRVEVVGSTAAIGRMLRRRHVDLPSLQGFRRAADARRREINGATDRQIDLDEQLRGLRNQEARADLVLTALEGAPPARPPVTRAQILELLGVQRDSIVALQKTFGRYVTDLTALDVAERQLVLAADGFLDFIDRQLIWIQSIPPLSVADAALVPAALGWLLSPSSWVRALTDLSSALRDRPLRALLVVAVVVAIVLVRRESRGRLRAMSEQTRRIRSDRFALTLWALLYTAVAAGAWPLLLAVLAWQLAASPSADGFTLSVSAGLAAVAIFVFTLDSVRRMCPTNGLGDRHFRWSEPLRAQVGAALRRFIVLGTPLVFLVAMTAEFAEPAHMRGLGRPAFVALMLVLVLFVNRLCGHTSALITQFDRLDAPNRAAQLRVLWFPALVGAPVIMAALSLVGYHHSALEIEDPVRETAWLAVGLLVVRELVLRMLYIAERRLRFDDALKRREEAKMQRGREEPEAPVASADDLRSVEEPDIDFHDLGHQAQRVVNILLLIAVAVGLWAIWNELLPALNILDKVSLPMVTRELVDGVERQVPVTLGDLGVALLVLAGALFAAKNLTGLLEIAILQRLPLDPGGRYAIVTLSQYAIVAVGFIVAFAKIGAEWSSIQWLVAALSVGLGFGLQEIVANFISGIILLLERPIRVGDIVTVGDTSGTVARIRIRATAILNYDKQELLVPNKEFITGRVLNWTLTDKLNRLVINVGIAYGSDVDRALALLVEVAAEHPQVLDDPAATAIFERFGDNSLQLVLRCFLANLDFRVKTMTELHSTIHRRFNEEAIAIAFPQRDLHIDVVKPIEVRMSA